MATQLALASTVIEDEDLVLITLNGLPEESDSFKTIIRAWSKSISIKELCSLLCSKANHVEMKNKKSNPIEHPNVAFSVTRGSTSSSSNFNYSRGHSPNYWRWTSY